MRELADGVRRDTGDARRVVERVRLDAAAIRVEAGRGALDELAITEISGDDLAADRVGERDVRADVEAEPHVGPRGGPGPPRIDGVQPRASHPLQQMVKEDRVRLARVRAPEENEVSVLDLPIGARAAARAEYRRQTDDARGVSGAVAAVDVVAADDAARELLREVVHLVGRLRTAEQPEALRAVAPRSRHAAPGCVRALQSPTPDAELRCRARVVALAACTLVSCAEHKRAVDATSTCDMTRDADSEAGFPRAILARSMSLIRSRLNSSKPNSDAEWSATPSAGWTGREGANDSRSNTHSRLKANPEFGHADVLWIRKRKMATREAKRFAKEPLGLRVAADHPIKRDDVRRWKLVDEVHEMTVYESSRFRPPQARRL